MYFVIELQILPDGTPASIVMTTSDWNAAQAEFHRILSFAAVSTLPVHAAVILTETGNTIDKGAYSHALPEPEIVEAPADEE